MILKGGVCTTGCDQGFVYACAIHSDGPFSRNIEFISCNARTNTQNMSAYICAYKLSRVLFACAMCRARVYRPSGILGSKRLVPHVVESED